MKEEIWKSLDFVGYPDYEVSNFGKVKSLNYNHSGKERILKQSKNCWGYLYVCLSKDYKQKKFTVHRLVALAFLKNPENLPQVNHKDENKENNHVNNLEFCNHLYNMNYGTRNERVSKTKKGKIFTEEHKRKLSEAKKGKGNKPILQYTKNNVFIREFESIIQASIELNIDSSSITKCCKGVRKTSGGFVWRYKE